MGLADDLVASYFRRARSANLVNAGVVVEVGHPLEWVIDGGVASATAEFGPFRHALSFDSIELVDHATGVLIERYSLGGQARVLPGMKHSHRFVVTVSEMSGG